MLHDWIPTIGSFLVLLVSVWLGRIQSRKNSEETSREKWREEMAANHRRYERNFIRLSELYPDAHLEIEDR